VVTEGIRRSGDGRQEKGVVIEDRKRSGDGRQKKEGGRKTEGRAES
jgi:hypothetical protein